MSDFFDSTLVAELVIVAFVVLIFLAGGAINNMLVRKGYKGFDNVIKTMCVALSTKVMKKMEEKDKNLHEANLRIQEGLANTTFMPTQEDTTAKDKVEAPKEEKKDESK